MYQTAILRPPASTFATGITTANLGQPDYEKALEQHRAYWAALQQCGLQLILLDADELEEMGDIEEDRLDMGFDVRPYSRLGCQVKVPDDPEDLVVEISEESIATWYNEHPEHRHEQHKKGVPA